MREKLHFSRYGGARAPIQHMQPVYLGVTLKLITSAQILAMKYAEVHALRKTTALVCRLVPQMNGTLLDDFICCFCETQVNYVQNLSSHSYPAANLQNWV